MPQDGKQQQQQGNHQLPPLFPPSGVGGSTGTDRFVQQSLPGRETAISECSENRGDITCRLIQIKPGRSADEIDVSPLNTGLLLKRTLNSAHATAALHSLDIEDDGLHR